MLENIHKERKNIKLTVRRKDDYKERVDQLLELHDSMKESKLYYIYVLERVYSDIKAFVETVEDNLTIKVIDIYYRQALSTLDEYIGQTKQAIEKEDAEMQVLDNKVQAGEQVSDDEIINDQEKIITDSIGQSKNDLKMAGSRDLKHKARENYKKIPQNVRKDNKP